MRQTQHWLGEGTKNLGLTTQTQPEFKVLSGKSVAVHSRLAQPLEARDSGSKRAVSFWNMTPERP